MPRIARVAPGGQVYHIINRANGRLRLFKKEQDFIAFEEAMLAASRRHPVPILAWCLMGNHWHFVVHPRKDGDLARFFGYLTLLHATRWQVAHDSIGIGHIYQGRFKSFMIEKDEHLLWVLRYVERNPLRAKLVKRAEDWRWSSLHVHRNGPAEMQSLMTEWPIDRPRNWLVDVNRPQTAAEEAAIVNAIRRACPLGKAVWVNRMVKQHDLQSTLRPRGRPAGWKKNPADIGT